MNLQCFLFGHDDAVPDADLSPLDPRTWPYHCKRCWKSVPAPILPRLVKGNDGHWYVDPPKDSGMPRDAKVKKR